MLACLAKMDLALEKTFQLRGRVKDYWGEISERFDEWTSPLRPSSEDVEMFKNLTRSLLKDAPFGSDFRVAVIGLRCCGP